MSWFRFLLVCLLVSTFTLPAPAGWLFKSKKPKPKPEERVPELIVIVKTDQDEGKREAAAAELRQYDPKAFAEIVPILIDVLKNDPKISVRQEAAGSLSHIRPISQEAGMALETAASKDPSLRVRMQAKKSLLYYHLSGYRSVKKNDIKPNGDSPEPPLAREDHPKRPQVPAPPASPGPILPSAGTSEPLPNRLFTDRSVAQPLPPGPVKSPLIPVEPPKLQSPPTHSEEQEGPLLLPPQ
jgi:hypothetical protein